MQTASCDLFEQILAKLQQMQELLEQEALNLKSRDAEALQKTTRQKEILANDLDALARRQEVFLFANHLEGIDRSLSVPLATDSQITAIRQTWQVIRDLTHTCQRLNEANGAYIGLLRQHVQRSVDILYGQSSQDVVYDRDGVSHRSASSRKLLSV